MEIVEKPTYKLTDSLLFLIATLVFLLTYTVTFKGFNGTDDMHYSMLSAAVLQHRFSPFVPADVFCGRVGLILVQSAIYAAGGISVFTTELGTLACTISCCWLVIFRLARPSNRVKTLVTASFFYFAPTLVPAIRGIMPDAYVMLPAVLLFIFWQKIFAAAKPRPRTLSSALFGIAIATAMLFKESAFVFIPLFVFLTLFYHRKESLFFLIPMLLAATTVVLVFGLGYYFFTGNFFFRMTQIHNSQLIENLSPGSCNCRLDTPHLIERLTYGPWKSFLLQGFLPVLMPLAYLLFRSITRKNNRLRFSMPETVFLSLLLILLYFPANFQQYQPVCSDARQYLMLMPFGVWVMAEPLYQLFSVEAKKTTTAFLLPGVAFLLLCLILWLSLNKWKWLTYGLWLGALLLPLIAGKRYALSCSFCLLLAMSATATERLFFFNAPWFKNLSRLHEKLGTVTAYFPDHDNCIHWKFLGGYTNRQVFNVEPRPPLVPALYYDRPVAFTPGWFILDRDYTIRSAAFMAAIDQLERTHLFSATENVGDVSAFKIDSASQLGKIEDLFRLEP